MKLTTNTVSDDDEPIAVVKTQALMPGKDEMNFAENPITLLTDRVPAGQTSIEYENWIFDTKRKQMIHQRRSIQASEKYGLPTASDNLVILALIQLTKQRGNFATPDLEFSRLELLNLLGWKDEGGNYKRIKESLLRIKTVNYIYDNAWWDNRQEKWTTRAFSILDNVEINDSRTANAQGSLFPSRIKWNEVVFDSFKAGYLRDIDFELCIRLEHPTAVALYRFLGKRFYIKTEWVFDLKELSQKHVGLGRNYEGGTQLARKLKPAIRELEAEGFLEPLSEQERFTKKGRAWSVRFVKKLPVPEQGAPQLSATTPNANPPAKKPKTISPLVVALTNRGISGKAAGELVAKHPAESIQLQIENLEWRVAKKLGKIADPAAWLVVAIKDGHATPEGFESSADREKREQARQSTSDQASENRRDKREEEMRAGKVTAFIKTMTADALSEFQARALDLADASLRDAYEQQTLASIKKMLLSKIVRQAVCRRLGLPLEA